MTWVMIGTILDIYSSQNKLTLLGFHIKKNPSPVKQDEGMTYKYIYMYIYTQVDSL